jgi:hypothetical protein
MKIKEEFFNRGVFKIGNGEDTRFWEDSWLGDVPLARQYPSLYNIAQRKQVSVASVMSRSPLNIEFRRALTGTKWSRWLHLVRRLMDVLLSNHNDVFV